MHWSATNSKALTIKSVSLIMAAAQCYCGLCLKFSECSPNPLNHPLQHNSGDITPLHASKSPWNPSFQVCALQPGRTCSRVILRVSWQRKLTMFLGLLSGSSRTFTAEQRLVCWGFCWVKAFFSLLVGTFSEQSSHTLKTNTLNKSIIHPKTVK